MLNLAKQKANLFTVFVVLCVLHHVLNHNFHHKRNLYQSQSLQSYRDAHFNYIVIRIDFHVKLDCYFRLNG